MFSRDKLLHPATIISCVALFVALGGVTYAAATIGTAQIKDSAVTSSKIKAYNVTNSRLGSASVSTSKLGNSSVIGNKIKSAAVTGSKIATGAVGASQIAANSITPAQIADNTVIEGQGISVGRHLTIGSGAVNTALVDFAGLGSLRASCAAGTTTTNFVNNSGSAINIRYWGVSNAAADVAIVSSSAPANGGVISAPNNATGGIQGLTWQIGFTDSGGKSHVATVNTSYNNQGGTCVVDFQAQYTN